MRRSLPDFFMAIVIMVFVIACAGGPRFSAMPPEWISTPSTDTSSALTFRGTGVADSLPLAKEEALNELIALVLERMNFDDPSRWKKGGRLAIESFKDDLESALRSPGYYILEGLDIIHNNAWKDEIGISYGISIAWEKQAFAEQSERLTAFTGIAEPRDFKLEDRARYAENDGNIYEAALIWGMVASIAETEGHIPNYRQALSEVTRIMNTLKYKVLSAPKEVFVDINPAEPVVINVSSGNRPVGNAEFVISYPLNTQNDPVGRGSARILSDTQGRISFSPPVILTGGSQFISIAPSATPFLEYLSNTEANSVVNFVKVIEDARFRVEYESYARDRTVPTGVIILETDLAGNPLNSSSVANGVIDDLLADGFDVSIMQLDPREILSRNEETLLRDIKADSQYADKFSRIVHGIISLESFEQDGDSYTVRVSGSLFLSDIQRQTIIYRSEITKTSRAGNGQQAISTAFRQLGRSFATEFIDQAR